jgi:hypothetical protein
MNPLDEIDWSSKLQHTSSIYEDSKAIRDYCAVGKMLVAQILDSSIYYVGNENQYVSLKEFFSNKNCSQYSGPRYYCVNENNIYVLDKMHLLESIFQECKKFLNHSPDPSL